MLQYPNCKMTSVQTSVRHMRHFTIKNSVWRLQGKSVASNAKVRGLVLRTCTLVEGGLKEACVGIAAADV